MDRAFFIQTNDSQLIAARVAKFALETRGQARQRGIPVTIMNISELADFRAFAGTPFRRGSKMQIYDPNGVQSFTLSRFLPPELMGFSGRAVVIDPDVFAIADVSELFEIDLGNNAVGARRSTYGWDSGVMLLDCAKLTHWRMNEIFSGLRDLKIDYQELISLRLEASVLDLPVEWNSHDSIGPRTKMLHTTHLLTQPWKAGLPIDFAAWTVAPFFAPIARGPLRRLFAKRATHYLKHHEREVERTFMVLLKEALAGGALTNTQIDDAIARKFVRADLRERIG